jgi:hypothetical protein
MSAGCAYLIDIPGIGAELTTIITITHKMTPIDDKRLTLARWANQTALICHDVTPCGYRLGAAVA